MLNLIEQSKKDRKYIKSLSKEEQLRLKREMQLLKYLLEQDEKIRECARDG